MFVITLKKPLASRAPSLKISKCKSAENRGIHAEIAEELRRVRSVAKTWVSSIEVA
jgi:hypothetical protein